MAGKHRAWTGLLAVIVAALSVMPMSTVYAVEYDYDESEFPIPDRLFLDAFTCDELWASGVETFYSIEEPNQAQCWPWEDRWGPGEVSYGWMFIPDALPYNLIPWEFNPPYRQEWFGDEPSALLAEEMREILDALVSDGHLAVSQQDFGPLYSWTADYESMWGSEVGPNWGMTVFQSTLVYGPVEAVASMIQVLPGRIAELEADYLSQGIGPDSLQSIREEEYWEKWEESPTFSCEDFVPADVLGQGFAVEAWDTSGVAVRCFLQAPSNDGSNLGQTWDIGYYTDPVYCFDERALATHWERQGALAPFVTISTVAGVMTTVDPQFADPQEVLDRPKINGEPVTFGYVDNLAMCTRFYGWPEAIVEMIRLLGGEVEAGEAETPSPSPEAPESNNALSAGPETNQLTPPSMLLAGSPASLTGGGLLSSLLQGALIAGLTSAPWLLMTYRRRRPRVLTPSATEEYPKKPSRGRAPIAMILGSSLLAVLAASVLSSPGPTIFSLTNPSATFLFPGLVAWGGGAAVVIALGLGLAVISGYRLGRQGPRHGAIWIAVLLLALVANALPVFSMAWIPLLVLIPIIAVVNRFSRPEIAAGTLLWSAVTVGFGALLGANLVSQTTSGLLWLAAIMAAIGFMTVGSSPLLTVPLARGPGAVLLEKQPILWVISAISSWSVWVLLFVDQESPLAWITPTVIGLGGSIVVMISQWLGGGGTERFVEPRQEELDTPASTRGTI